MSACKWWGRLKSQGSLICEVPPICVFQGFTFLWTCLSFSAWKLPFLHHIHHGLVWKARHMQPCSQATPPPEQAFLLQECAQAHLCREQRPSQVPFLRCYLLSFLMTVSLRNLVSKLSCLARTLQGSADFYAFWVHVTLPGLWYLVAGD